MFKQLAAVQPRVQIDAVEAKTLIIYDDAESGLAWSGALKAAGIDAVTTHICPDTFTFWSEILPDLIVIEDFDGDPEELALCVRLRRETTVPILLLTAQPDEAFHLRAYRSGVDECIAVPVNPLLFVAKVQAWLRRTLTLPTTTLDTIGVGGFQLEPARRRLTTESGHTLRLTNLELRLLLVLMSSPGRAVDQVALIERVWGPYGGGDAVMLKNVVYRLRRKLEPEPHRPRHLLTVDQTGYRFMG
jgi:DNA-binding response OmpR family regulator